ncbi:unnamed protein product [Oreochromis niloticus]|nr:unnamed protein product [Mustela putorius furo]
MNILHSLIYFFFVSLQDGNPEVTNAQILSYGVIGGNVTVPLVFQSSGTWKMFCREDCEGENILIKTTDVRAQTGRYSIEYKRESTVYVLSVSISKLTESDSGQYSCGLGGSSSSASYERFGVFVAEALLDGNNDPAQLKHFDKETGSSLTVGCYFKQPENRALFCRGECGGNNTLVQTDDVKAQRGRYSIGYASHTDPGVLYVSITQLTKSDSGRYRCLLSGSSSSSSREFEVTVTDVIPSLTGQNQYGLYVGLTLTVTIILVSVSVLIFYKKRSSKRKDVPVETQYADVTEATDNSNKPTHSALSFLNKARVSPKNASCSNTDEVVSSVSRVRRMPEIICCP